MKLIDLKLIDFINEVDSKSPAPGGGSVSALLGTLGVSLSRMVGHLTLGKKKYLALDVSIQEEFEKTITNLEVKKQELLHLIDLDTEAFNLIMEAFKLPKNTADEIKIRNLKIEQATKIAIDIPLKVAKTSYESLILMDIIIKYGNKTAISDLGVSVLNLSSAIEGAIMNMLINLPGISDIDLKNKYQNQITELLEKTTDLKQNYLNIVYKALKG